MAEPGQAVLLDHGGLALDQGQAVVHEFLGDAIVGLESRGSSWRHSVMQTAREPCPSLTPGAQKPTCPQHRRFEPRQAFHPAYGVLLGLFTELRSLLSCSAENKLVRFLFPTRLLVQY